MPDCRRRDKYKNRDAIMGGTWDPPPADLPMDLVIDEDELDPEVLAVATENSLRARSE